MCKVLFKQIIFGKKTILFKKKNKHFLNTISPIIFNKKITIHSGKKEMSRYTHFFHNKLKVDNLFLTKKIKPQPILKKK